MFSPDGWILKEIWTPNQCNMLIMSQMAKNEGYCTIKTEKLDGHYCLWLVKPENIPALKSILAGGDGDLRDQEELSEIRGMLARSGIMMKDLNV